MDWYPWGTEALERAEREDRPILLSIGYSACHWCHVMERESFEDADTARLMNEAFVCIKVDREERPDVDAIYMRAVQALTGRGGWPLTVFLTPGGEPFYGGTYFPPEPRQGMPSFRQVLEAADAAWRDRRKEVRGAADEIRALLNRSNLGPREEGAQAPAVDETLIGRAARSLIEHLDPVHGGFGRAPKFPQPVVLQFLLEHHAATGDQPALDAALLTLRQLARGGVRDHLGGGFHRYAVDARWLVPHFEKMLYDNALLADAYLRAFQLTGDGEWEGVCREVLDDLLDDFRSPEGAFYTARDADSEGEEGLFYLWTPREIAEVLDPEEARLFARCYDVTEEGNFEGRNILHLPHALDVVARDEGMATAELEDRLRRSRRRLGGARARREPPLRDEKILASWNGLALRALADAGAALGEPRYVEAAGKGAGWLMSVLRPGSRLLHQITGGTAKIPAFLADVTSMGNALVSLHEATLDPRWLREAVDLDAEVERRFRDPDTGLLHDTPSDGEALLIRPREVTDSPLPSGASLAAELRLRLGRLLADPDRVEEAREIVAREASLFDRMPTGFGRFLSVAERLISESVEIVIVGTPGDPERARLLHEAHRRFLPGRVITGAEPGTAGDGGTLTGDGRPGSSAQTALLAGRGLIEGRPAAYLCRGFTCDRPTADPLELASQLDDLHRARSR